MKSSFSSTATPPTAPSQSAAKDNAACKLACTADTAAISRPVSARMPDTRCLSSLDAPGFGAEDGRAKHCHLLFLRSDGAFQSTTAREHVT
jgi:hypothetical protein